ncbi:unnamed protein product [Prorocentrum cordatum]|uniref:Uncharacterized protein n=1 Tax=Prorocentrum cordatum TaxID=2364126 RepID=A0ABN9Y3Q2_9DINO|nr:unnamed protein product [Polarella glacialis]
MASIIYKAFNVHVGSSDSKKKQKNELSKFDNMKNASDSKKKQKNELSKFDNMKNASDSKKKQKNELSKFDNMKNALQLFALRRIDFAQHRNGYSSRC